LAASAAFFCVLQAGGALDHLLFQTFPVGSELIIASLDLFQHAIETLNQGADLVLVLRLQPQAEILPFRHLLHTIDQVLDGAGNAPLHRPGQQVNTEHDRNQQHSRNPQGIGDLIVEGSQTRLKEQVPDQLSVQGNRMEQIQVIALKAEFCDPGSGRIPAPPLVPALHTGSDIGGPTVDNEFPTVGLEQNRAFDHRFRIQRLEECSRRFRGVEAECGTGVDADEIRQ
jgi:hypothetical protein